MPRVCCDDIAQGCPAGAPVCRWLSGSGRANATDLWGSADRPPRFDLPEAPVVNRFFGAPPGPGRRRPAVPAAPFCRGRIVGWFDDPCTGRAVPMLCVRPAVDCDMLARYSFSGRRFEVGLGEGY